MTSDRIKEIQERTAYPDSVSVKQALLQVWNECEQERKKVCPHCGKSDMNKVKYTAGLQMGQFKRIEEISHYNYNYYVGFDKDLLFGKSDDDNTTEWWLISNGNFHYLGESYTTENDLLHLYDKPCT